MCPAASCNLPPRRAGPRQASGQDEPPIPYENRLHPISDPSPLLADYPRYVQPLEADRRYLAPPVVNDEGGELIVRS